MVAAAAARQQRRRQLIFRPSVALETQNRIPKLRNSRNHAARFFLEVPSAAQVTPICADTAPWVLGHANGQNPQMPTRLSQYPQRLLVSFHPWSHHLTPSNNNTWNTGHLVFTNQTNTCSSPTSLRGCGGAAGCPCMRIWWSICCDCCPSVRPSVRMSVSQRSGASALDFTAAASPSVRVCELLFPRRRRAGQPGKSIEGGREGGRPSPGDT